MIKGDDVTAKAESFGLREDNRLKADFQDSDLATFCHKAGTGYPVLSDSCPESPHPICHHISL